MSTGTAVVLPATLAALAAALALAGPSEPRAHRSVRPRGDGAVPQPPGRTLWTPAVLHLAAAGGAAGTALLLLPGGLGVAAAVVAAIVVWRRSQQWESASLRHRRARLEAELPHVVDLMVAALAAGAAPGDALAKVAEVVEEPTAEELADWVSRLRLGADPVAVWATMARHPQLGRLGTALQRSAESGAPVTAALARLAADLRARRRADVEARVRQVEVKAAVPLGVCLLPAFILVGVVPLVAGSALGLLAR